MKSEKLSLDHINLLSARLQDIHIGISEYCFSNLYLFRQAHDYDVLTNADGDIFIGGVTYDNNTYLMPTVDLSRASADEVARFIEASKQFDTIFPIPEEWLHLFPEDQFDRGYNEDDTDYIFTAQKLQKYPGRKLHKKRNLLKQFNENYVPSMQRLTDKTIPIAMEILEEWQEDMPVARDGTDFYPCKEALTLKDELELCGAIFMADNKPAGFILGEDIYPEMFGLHFAKGDKNVKGLYQYMFHRTADLLAEDYDLFNMEQDMGKSALRVAKSSYQPDQLVHKYRITAKQE